MPFDLDNGSNGSDFRTDPEYRQIRPTVRIVVRSTDPNDTSERVIEIPAILEKDNECQ
jgi:hypothetical protein